MIRRIVYMVMIVTCSQLMDASSSLMNIRSDLDAQLNILEGDAKKTTQGFNEMSKSMSIASISESIISKDAHQLKHALSDVINLNKMVNSQVNISIQFWNMYLDSVKIPTMDSYLLGQVMNSLISTIRALSLRSSLDQAMILSFIKKYFGDEAQAKQPEMSSALEVTEVTIDDRWKKLHIE